MIIKQYKANTNVSINVVLPSKKNMHISFIPLSDGSSVFQTYNEDIQRAIESHYNFGRLFRLVGTSGMKAPTKKSPAKAVLPASALEDAKTVETEVHIGEETVQDETTEIARVETDTEESTEVSTEEEVAEESGDTDTGDDNGLRKVTVSDIATAKDYLADTLGISRTSMRSTKSILQKAMENGIRFVGI